MGLTINPSAAYCCLRRHSKSVQWLPFICRSAKNRGHCHRVRTFPSQACAWRHKHNYIIITSWYFKLFHKIKKKMIKTITIEQQTLNKENIRQVKGFMLFLRLFIKHNITEGKGLSLTRVRRETTTTDFVVHNFSSWLWASCAACFQWFEWRRFVFNIIKNWKIACTHWTKSLIFNFNVCSCIA